MKLTWEEFKKLVKHMRRNSKHLTKLYRTQTWTTINIHVNENQFILEVNPFCCNLRDGWADLTDAISGNSRRINLKNTAMEIW